MPVKFDWDDAEQTMGIYVLSGNWTWDELQPVMTDSWTQISKRDGIVDSIMIFENRFLPANPMPQLRKMTTERPANTGIVVAVGAGIIQRSVIQVFTRIYSSTLGREVPILIAESVDQARQILAKRKAERGQSAQTD